MDLRRLKYFVTVVELGSFSRAAAHLCISQPPLSQRIQELENEMGGELIDRRSRPLKTTVAGRLFISKQKRFCSAQNRCKATRSACFIRKST